MNILAIEGSTRIDSATAIMLKHKIGKEPLGTKIRMKRLLELNIPLFTDQRHDRDWKKSDDLEELLADMIWADQIILASPLYWYSVSHLMKNFIDHWTYYLRHETHPLKVVMKEKKFSFLVVGHGEESELTKPVFESLRYTVKFIGAECSAQEYFSEHFVRTQGEAEHSKPI